MNFNSACLVITFVLLNIGLKPAWGQTEDKKMVEEYHREFFSRYLSENHKCLEESDGTKFWNLTLGECFPCENEENLTDKINLPKEKHHACLEYFIKKKLKSYEVESRKCFQNSGGNEYYDQDTNQCMSYHFSPKYSINKKWRNYGVKNRKCFEKSGGTKYHDQDQNKCVPYDFPKVSHENGTNAFTNFLHWAIPTIFALLLGALYLKMKKNQKDAEKFQKDAEKFQKDAEKFQKDAEEFQKGARDDMVAITDSLSDLTTRVQSLVQPPELVE